MFLDMHRARLGELLNAAFLWELLNWKRSCVGGVNRTNPSSTQWLVRCQSLSKAKEIISGIYSRHLCFLFCFLAASISNVFFKMVFFSIVCFEQIGESFLRNNIAFMIHSDLVCVLYRSRLAALTCACGCPSASQLLVSQFKTVGRFFFSFFFTKSLQRVNCATVPDGNLQEPRSRRGRALVGAIERRLRGSVSADVLGDDQSFPE